VQDEGDAPQRAMIMQEVGNESQQAVVTHDAPPSSLLHPKRVQLC
jgi:hypothetical protein